MKSLTLLALVVYLARGSCGMTFQEKYDIWSQDLLPGFVIETSIVDGQKCHCKVPGPSSTTITSSPHTTTTSMPPTTTTSTPPSTTTSTPPTTSTSTPPTTTTSTPPTTTTSTPPTTTTSTTPPPTTTTSTPPTTSTSTPPTTTTSTPPTTTTTSTTTPKPTTTTTTTTTPKPTTTTTTTTSTTTPKPTTTSTTTSTSTTKPTTTSTTTSTSTTKPTTTSTTTSTSTTKPTTTTTSTTTSTTTTKPTTTTTTTPKTTTTTTTPKTTTTTTTSTTTTKKPTPVNCGTSCNVTYNLNKANYPTSPVNLKWDSPNYPNNYPDGCVCQITVNLQAFGFVEISFATGSTIYSNSNCQYDRLVMSGDLLQPGNVCDTTMDSYSDFIMNADGVPQSFTGTFYSVTGDGNTVAKGFRMNIYVELWMWRDGQENLPGQVQLDRSQSNAIPANVTQPKLSEN
ncbi:uncharacterized protein LOC135212264 [Macrobrachium nipponense]|uniref:uncharacterized protein LOC135212264 n=1 Tax=Macrobrachium nipponense TaxID=159736 RepID=UPI0030C7BC06